MSVLSLTSSGDFIITCLRIHWTWFPLHSWNALSAPCRVRAVGTEWFQIIVLKHHSKVNKLFSITSKQSKLRGHTWGIECDWSTFNPYQEILIIYFLDSPEWNCQWIKGCLLNGYTSIVSIVHEWVIRDQKKQEGLISTWHATHWSLAYWSRYTIAPVQPLPITIIIAVINQLHQGIRWCYYSANDQSHFTC